MQHKERYKKERTKDITKIYVHVNKGQFATSSIDLINSNILQ